MAGMKGDLGLGSAIGAKPQNPECLAKAFDAHADEADKKIAREDLADVLYASGTRMLNWELKEALTHAGEPERIDRATVESISLDGPRFLNTEWAKEDEAMENFNPYQQTYEAFKVLADSYGQNGLIDIVNLRYLLTSCGEEMTDDELDVAFKEIGQSSKGFFHLNKLLTAYHDLSKQVGRCEKHQAQYAAVLHDIESSKKRKPEAQARRQSKIMLPGAVAMVGLGSRAPSAAGSRVPSRANSEKAESEKGDESP
jgi:Ca2+-binding EF-hand superfamily protein